jgi:hypothetical protein
MAQDRSGDAAQQGALYSSSPMASYNDEIRSHSFAVLAISTDG